MPSSCLAFGTVVAGSAWTAAADATNDGAPAAHNRATIPTIRVAAATSALKVLVMGAFPRDAAGGVFRILKKALEWPHGGIFDRDMAKRLYRHANVSESLLGHRLTSHTSTAPPQSVAGVRRAGLIPNRNQRS